MLLSLLLRLQLLTNILCVTSMKVQLCMDAAGFLRAVKPVAVLSHFLTQRVNSLKYEQRLLLREVRNNARFLVPFSTNKVMSGFVVVIQELCRHSDIASILSHELIMPITFYGNVIAVQEGKTTPCNTSTQQISSVMVLVVEVVLTVMLLISPVVAVSCFSFCRGSTVARLVVGERYCAVSQCCYGLLEDSANTLTDC